MKLAFLPALILMVGCQSTTTATPPIADHLASPSPTIVATAVPAHIDVCHRNGITYCAINPLVTQDTVERSICTNGWTKLIRPAQSYTDNLKRLQLTQFASQHPSDINWNLQGTEEDHRLPLELGGAPSDANNLSPEEPASPNAKDTDETQFKRLVCNGKVGLPTAQVQFIAKWLGPYPTYIK